MALLGEAEEVGCIVVDGDGDLVESVVDNEDMDGMWIGEVVDVVVGSTIIVRQFGVGAKMNLLMDSIWR